MITDIPIECIASIAVWLRFREILPMRLVCRRFRRAVDGSAAEELFRTMADEACADTKNCGLRRHGQGVGGGVFRVRPAHMRSDFVSFQRFIRFVCIVFDELDDGEVNDDSDLLGIDSFVQRVVDSTSRTLLVAAETDGTSCFFAMPTAIIHFSRFGKSPAAGPSQAPSGIVAPATLRSARIYDFWRVEPPATGPPAYHLLLPATLTRLSLCGINSIIGIADDFLSRHKTLRIVELRDLAALESIGNDFCRQCAAAPRGPGGTTADRGRRVDASGE